MMQFARALLLCVSLIMSERYRVHAHAWTSFKLLSTLITIDFRNVVRLNCQCSYVIHVPSNCAMVIFAFIVERGNEHSASVDILEHRARYCPPRRHKDFQVLFTRTPPSTNTTHTSLATFAISVPTYDSPIMASLSLLSELDRLFVNQLRERLQDNAPLRSAIAELLHDTSVSPHRDATASLPLLLKARQQQKFKLEKYHHPGQATTALFRKRDAHVAQKSRFEKLPLELREIV